MASNTESEINETENIAFDSNQISSDEQFTQIIDSINENTNTEESPTTTTAAARTPGQTAIGAKLVKKLEKFGILSEEIFFFNPKIFYFLAANSKENNNKTPLTTTTTDNVGESDPRRNINKTASMLEISFKIYFLKILIFFFLENLMKNLTDPDPQKNLLSLATKLAELQEQNRLTQSKITEIEKRSTVLIRERDQVLLENSRITAAKMKLESLCRELHKHNQQIRVTKISINYSLIKIFLG